MHEVNWLVAQIGSRELYACPVSFSRRGHLKRFYTDIWWRRWPALLARMPGPMWGLSRRHHAELPDEKVTSFNGTALWRELRGKIVSGPGDAAASFRDFVETGRWFGTAVAGHMRGESLDPHRDALFAFSTGALEPLKVARERGLFSVVDQLDPARVDQDMIREESERWPGWEPRHGDIPEAYFARLAAEWDAADLIVVNSEFSRKAMQRQGVPQSKLLVVPLCYEKEWTLSAKPVAPASRPLRVLWLGQIVLRKGIPYLLEAARLLGRAHIEFAVAGNIGISEGALKSAPGNVRILGKVTRERVLQLYAESDVFVLPTISDGFAITQLEAMSFGLPVITTPNCGDVVTPGVDGFIVPIRDPHALAAAIQNLHEDRQLLETMSGNALLKCRQFTFERYARTIEEETLRRRDPAYPSSRLNS